jgi:nicotinate-nucleotide pyrophosphorylase (carboxylating)
MTSPTSPILPPPPSAVDDVLRRALAEDLGTAGDLTTNATLPIGASVTGHIVARAAGTIAGLDAALRVFDLLDGEVVATPTTADGDRVARGTKLASLSGSARAVLGGERTCLNLLGHLSGVATGTSALVDAVAGLDTRISDTRKTTPGLRALEKYAVRCGGGSNHRFGLHDAVMLKDNHLAATGSITAAVRAVRAAVGHLVVVELEVDHLEQIPEALAAGVDVILLDNMGPEVLREAVELVAGRAVTEASGGITPASVRDIAASGVDVVSAGWITHSVPRLDVALDLT